MSGSLLVKGGGVFGFFFFLKIGEITACLFANWNHLVEREKLMLQEKEANIAQEIVSK